MYRRDCQNLSLIGERVPVLFCSIQEKHRVARAVRKYHQGSSEAPHQSDKFETTFHIRHELGQALLSQDGSSAIRCRISPGRSPCSSARKPSTCSLLPIVSGRD